MPSLKCHQCGKVKRCQMVIVEAPEKHSEYLCKPCLRELGYSK